MEYTLFSWNRQKGVTPISVKDADGVYLYDYDGRCFLDFSSGLAGVSLGHGDPRVRDAVMRQVQQPEGVQPGNRSRPWGHLGERLASVAPEGLSHTLFTTGGAGPVEEAVKLARLYTGRSKVLARPGALSRGSFSAMGDPGEEATPAHTIPFTEPHCYRCPWGKSPEDCGLPCLDHVREVVLREGPESIAAIVLEGEEASSGYLKYPTGYLGGIRELCNQHGIVFIADEVLSGFGRTGKWFAMDHYGVVPDIIAAAKGITSGYVPLGALIVSKAIARHFEDAFRWLGLTYATNPVSAAAGMEVFRIYEEEQILAHVQQMGDYLENRMQALRAQHPSIGEFRGRGLLGCLELVRDRRARTMPVEEPDVMQLFSDRMQELGLYAFVRENQVFIAPPLTITRDEMEEGLNLLSEALLVADAYSI